jgi:hypothetical protein
MAAVQTLSAPHRRGVLMNSLAAFVVVALCACEVRHSNTTDAGRTSTAAVDAARGDMLTLQDAAEASVVDDATPPGGHADAALPDALDAGAPLDAPEDAALSDPPGALTVGGSGYELFVTDWQTSGRVSGAKFCRVANATDCVVSDDDGRAVFRGLPELTPVLLSVARDGYVGLLKHFVTPSKNLAVARDPFTFLIPTELWTGWAEQSGVTLEPDKGHILFYMLRSSGGSVELRPAAGKRVYFTSMQELDQSLDQLVSGAPGLGIFFNVPPGKYDAVFSNPGRRCIFGMETGWPGTSSDSSRVEVEAGYVSFPAFGICNPT